MVFLKKMIKVIVTTSNRYLHIIPVFAHLYNKFWGAPFELVGYEQPESLPANCTFVSLGKQGDKSEFSSDMKRYFQDQPQHFVWMMEDTFIREPVKFPSLNYCVGALTKIKEIGRISLTSDSFKYYSQLYFRGYFEVYQTPQDSFYRLSLQPAIWNRDYLVKHLHPGLDPWQFEKQTANIPPEKVFVNVTLEKDRAPLASNEGVRKINLHEYDFHGMDEHTLKELKQLI